jgi:hypothetical protein
MILVHNYGWFDLTGTFGGFEEVAKGGEIGGYVEEAEHIVRFRVIGELKRDPDVLKDPDIQGAVERVSDLPFVGVEGAFADIVVGIVGFEFEVRLVSLLPFQHKVEAGLERQYLAIEVFGRLGGVVDETVGRFYVNFKVEGLAGIDEAGKKFSIQLGAFCEEARAVGGVAGADGPKGFVLKSFDKIIEIPVTLLKKIQF